MYKRERERERERKQDRERARERERGGGERGIALQTQKAHPTIAQLTSVFEDHLLKADHGRKLLRRPNPKRVPMASGCGRRVYGSWSQNCRLPLKLTAAWFEAGVFTGAAFWQSFAKRNLSSNKWVLRNMLLRVKTTDQQNKPISFSFCWYKHLDFLLCCKVACFSCHPSTIKVQYV